MSIELFRTQLIELREQFPNESSDFYHLIDFCLALSEAILAAPDENAPVFKVLSFLKELYEITPEEREGARPL